MGTPPPSRETEEGKYQLRPHKSSTPSATLYTFLQMGKISGLAFVGYTFSNGEIFVFQLGNFLHWLFAGCTHSTNTITQRFRRSLSSTYLLPEPTHSVGYTFFFPMRKSCCTGFWRGRFSGLAFRYTALHVTNTAHITRPPSLTNQPSTLTDTVTPHIKH